MKSWILLKGQVDDSDGFSALASNMDINLFTVEGSCKKVSLAHCRTVCYMSKCTYGHVLVLPSRRLIRTAAEDDFVIEQFVKC